MWGHGYKGWYNIAQSAEFDMQHVRVHSKALELIGDVWKLVGDVQNSGHTLTAMHIISPDSWFFLYTIQYQNIV